MYDGGRQAPPNLSNQLPEETDSNPDTWLTHHMLIPAFLHRIANASNIQNKIFLNRNTTIRVQAGTIKLTLVLFE